jgi:hypothetical protein
MRTLGPKTIFIKQVSRGVSTPQRKDAPVLSGSQVSLAPSLFIYCLDDTASIAQMRFPGAAAWKMAFLILAVGEGLV